MKNRLQIRYHIPESLPTRDQAMTYLQDAFAIGRTNDTNASLPAEPLVILYNDTQLDIANGITEAKRLETSNVLLAIGRGGDGINVLNNQDYFVIDFAKHDEEITKLIKDVENIYDIIDEIHETIEKMKADIKKNSDDITAIIKKIGEKGDQCEKDTVYGYIQCAHDAIEEEVYRAEDAEQDLRHSLEDETTRATNAENLLQSNIDNEANRAKQAESDLQAHIESEESSRIEGDDINRDAINQEINRAENAESELRQNVNNESNRAINEEKRIESKLDNEISRAASEENRIETKLSNDIHLEYERAFKAEGDLNKRIDDVTTSLNNEISRSITEDERAKNEEKRIESKLDNEISRSVNKDGLLDAKDAELDAKIYDTNERLSQEITRAELSEKQLSDLISAEALNRENADKVLQNQITENKHAIELEQINRENSDTVLNTKIESNSKHISENQVHSSLKTIIVTGPSENGTNIDVNVDNKTIVINETGTLSVASDALVQYNGENAVKVSEVVGGTKTISLIVNEKDNILTNDENGLLSTLSLKWVRATVTGEKDEIQLIGKNDAIISRIDVADFIKDGMLDNVKLDSSNPSSPVLIFTFNSASGKEVLSVNVKDLVDVYFAGNGLSKLDNTFSVMIDANAEHFLTVGTDGIKLSGVQNAINTSKNEVLTSISTEVDKLNVSIKSLENSLNDEINARNENDSKIIADYKEADSLIRQNFANEDAKIRTEFKTSDETIIKNYQDADILLRTEFTASDETIIKNYQDADVLLRTEFTTSDAAIIKNYQDADVLLRTEFTASDNAITEAYKSADSQIISDYKSADEAIISSYQLSDAQLQNNIDTTNTKLDTEIEKCNTTIQNNLTESKTYTDNAVNTEKERSINAENELNTSILTEKSRAELAEQNLLSKVDINTQALRILNGDTTVDGSIKDIIFDSVLGTVVTTINIDDATEQSLIKKFTIDGIPYVYTSNSSSDMKHNGNALNTVIDSLRSDIDNTTSDTNKLKADVDNLTTKVNENSTNINAINTNVEINKNDISVLKEDVKTLETNVNTLENEINNTINSLLAPMQATIASLQGELATVKAQLELANTNLTNTTNELNNTKVELQALKSSAITQIKGTENEIAVTTEGNTATVKFADDAYFVAGI